MSSFNEMNLPVLLRRALDKNKLSVPTPIQMQAIPLSLEGKDIIGSARTGAGKTLAFSIPLVAKLLNDPQIGLGLVIVPTRELACQIRNEIGKLLFQSSVLRFALLIGGEPILKQLNQLKKNPQIVIGTPGRIIDHIERRTLVTSNVSFLVLDEMDHMFDIGFGFQIEEIMKYLPKTRQTLMFSATIPSNVIKLAEKYLNQPERIFIDCEAKTSAKIKQEVIYVSELEKYGKLVTQLCKRKGSIIVFVKTKQGADRLASKLYKDDYSALAIHGDLRQNKREMVINSFRRGLNQIMVATDVASRGLDIPHVQHVINYDIPKSQADYIHRIGRTARAGAEGYAISFVTPQDKRKLSILANKGGQLNFDCSMQLKKYTNKKIFSALRTKYSKKKINTLRKKRVNF